MSNRPRKHATPARTSRAPAPRKNRPRPLPKIGGYTVRSFALQTIVFTTPAGRILVRLPRDLANGDDFVGTIELEPVGRSAPLRKTNLRELSRFTLRMRRKSVPVRDGTFAARLGEKIDRTFYIVLARRGELVALARGECTSDHVGVQPTDPDILYFLSGGQAGEPTIIFGRFDELDARDVHVRIGGRPARFLAATPRSTIVEVPREVVGGFVIEAALGDRVWESRFVSAGVSVKYPPTTKGEERVPVDITVSGIENAMRPLPIELRELSGTLRLPKLPTLVLDPSKAVNGVVSARLMLDVLRPGTVEISCLIAPIIFLSTIYSTCLTCGRCQTECTNSDDKCTIGQTKDSPEEDDLAPFPCDPGVTWKRVKFNRTECVEVICRNFWGSECCRYTKNVTTVIRRWKKSTTTGADGKPVFVDDPPGAPCDCGTLLQIILDLGFAGADKVNPFKDMAKTRCPGLSFAEAGNMSRNCGFKGLFDNAITLDAKDWYELVQKIVGAFGGTGGGSPAMPPSTPPAPTGK